MKLFKIELVILCIISFVSIASQPFASDVRKPSVAGSFYPGSAKELGQEVDLFLKQANPPGVSGEIAALVVPHAGYEYSGQVAAYAFKLLEGKRYDTVVIVGNSHRSFFNGISIFNSGSFETPLGKVAVDSALADAILKRSTIFKADKAAHAAEHSLEVELPFLQRTLSNFKIVPILFGRHRADDYAILATAIAKEAKGKRVLVVASSDLSHYPSYEDANALDKNTVDAILTGRIGDLENSVAASEAAGYRNTATCACGIDAIKTAMEYAKQVGADDITLLNRANSGDVSADRSRVVGYAAIAFSKGGSMEGDLNKKQQEELLAIAKKSVEDYVGKGEIPRFETRDASLEEHLGAFVTLHKRGNLRGCIGRFSPADIPLYQVVSQMAIAAATQDTRFNPVSKTELPEIRYEISVLSMLKKADDWKKIRLGVDGVKVVRGYQSGVFLPQVATETGWDLETFLSELCSQKAGLPSECYKDKGTALYTFTAQVFGEN